MIYSAFLFLHSIVRWVAVIAAVHAIFRAWQGHSQQKPVEQVHRTGNIVFVASMHLNFLVGLILYVALSPITKAAFSDMGAAMKESAIRFFVVEHPFGMIIALVLATIGSARAKRADTDQKTHKTALLFFGLSFVVLMLSIPWPFYPAGRALFSLPF